MQVTRFLTSRSLVLSIVLHIVSGGVLIFSFEFSPKPAVVIKPAVNIIKAVSVDKKQVELELKRLKDKDDAKKVEELKRQKEIERKTEEAKKKLQAEEKKLKEIKKKKEREEKKRKDKQARIKKAEKEKKELEKKRKLEQEKREKEAEKKRKDEEIKRKEALQKELDAELNAELEAGQQQRDQSTLAKYFGLIKREIQNNFNRLGLPEGLSCVILIRLLEGGKVAEASIVKSSGNDLFDRRAETAVYSASPLPVPSAVRLFNKMRMLEIEFKPKN
ncbi:MAG: cell envelope integrity protein TolA [Proteobacteria bacterium]|nr:cell envelope integrity protein TolA [Pseudomonadota bacterium]